MTPRPWPEGTIPTAETLARWLKRCTRAEREQAAGALLAASDVAITCVMQDHDAAMAPRTDPLRPAVVWTPGGYR